MTGRPVGTTKEDARVEQIKIRFTADEKAAIESAARVIAHYRCEPEASIATVIRDFLLSEMTRYGKSLAPESSEYSFTGEVVEGPMVKCVKDSELYLAGLRYARPMVMADIQQGYAKREEFEL